MNVDLKALNVKIDSNRIVYLRVEKLSSELLPYNFPDEDFCIFKDFPFNQLIFPVLAYQNETTCSFSWLIQYLNYYDSSDNIIKIYINSLKDIPQVDKQCNFEINLNNCKITTINTSTDYIEYKQEFYNSLIYRLIDIILTVYFMPFLCSSGIVFNTLTIITLKNIKFKKNFESKLFKSILFCSVFNLLECILYLIYSINTCIYYGSYCSALGRYLSLQYYYTIFVEYFGSVFKLGSNLANILMTFSRYMMVSENKNSTLLKIYNSSIRLNLTIIIVISLVFNLVQFFEYKIDNQENLDRIQDFYVLLETQYPFQNLDFVPSINVYTYIKFIYYFLDNILCIIIILTIDIFLVVFIKRAKKQKSRLSSSNVKLNNSNITLMVIFNSSIILFTHCFDFLFAIFSILSSFYLKDVLNLSLFRCPVPYVIHINNCPFRDHFSNCVYFISFSLYFFLFFTFNKIFKKSFLCVFTRNRNFIKESISSFLKIV